MVQHLTDGRSVAINYRPIPDRGFVATFEDITERRLAEEKIRHLAHHDALTDLLNRAAFYERMEEVLAHRRRAESIGVLSLDLDHFKSVNDTLGHPIGDLLLQTAADRMRSCVRGEDIVARLGGDEFAIVQVPSEQPPDVVGARRPPDRGGRRTLSTSTATRWWSASASASRSRPADGDKPDTLMKNADLALYRAKADGGGLYRFFEVEMDARMQARRALELDLRKAIVNRRVRALLPADHRRQERADHQLRGAGPLASSRARHDSAARVHSGRGRDRPHRAARRVGAAAGLCRRRALAGSR